MRAERRCAQEHGLCQCSGQRVGDPRGQLLRLRRLERQHRAPDRCARSTTSAWPRAPAHRLMAGSSPSLGLVLPANGPAERRAHRFDDGVRILRRRARHRRWLRESSPDRGPARVRAAAAAARAGSRRPMTTFGTSSSTSFGDVCARRSSISLVCCRLSRSGRNAANRLRTRASRARSSDRRRCSRRRRRASRCDVGIHQAGSPNAGSRVALPFERRRGGARD